MHVPWQIPNEFEAEEKERGNYRDMRRKETFHGGIWFAFPSDSQETLGTMETAKIAHLDNCLIGGLPWCVCGGQLVEVSIFLKIY